MFFFSSVHIHGTYPEICDKKIASIISQENW